MCWSHVAASAVLIFTVVCCCHIFRARKKAKLEKDRTRERREEGGGGRREEGGPGEGKCLKKHTFISWSAEIWPRSTSNYPLLDVAISSSLPLSVSFSQALAADLLRC